MRVLLFTDSGQSHTLQLSSPWHIILPSLLLVTLIALFLGTGYALGSSANVPAYARNVVSQWQLALDGQRRQLDDARQNTRISLDVLTQRVGELQAHVNRIDALGSRLVKMAKLDADEFDFAQPPAMGGANDSASISAARDSSLLDALDGLGSQLEKRESELQALSHLLMNRNLQQAIYPAGWPVASGYISSGFGQRPDPFSGQSDFHSGIDFASTSGSGVQAVADGVVTFAGRDGGYGLMIELAHGNGYSTRYAHNQKVLVNVGQRVKKGDKISLMGSTGHSTGPHVHFEVLKDGKQINPDKFIKTASN